MKTKQDAQQAVKVAIATDNVPEGVLEEKTDGTVNVYDEDGNVVGSITKEEAETMATGIEVIKVE